MEDPVLETLEACRKTLAKVGASQAEAALRNEAVLRLQAIDRAILHHRRACDLQRLITGGIQKGFRALAAKDASKSRRQQAPVVTHHGRPTDERRPDGYDPGAKPAG